jgi:hypothetical protein
VHSQNQVDAMLVRDTRLFGYQSHLCSSLALELSVKPLTKFWDLQGPLANRPHLDFVEGPRVEHGLDQRPHRLEHHRRVDDADAAEHLLRKGGRRGGEGFGTRFAQVGPMPRAAPSSCTCSRRQAVANGSSTSPRSHQADLWVVVLVVLSQHADKALHLPGQVGQPHALHVHYAKRLVDLRAGFVIRLRLRWLLGVDRPLPGASHGWLRAGLRRARGCAARRPTWRPASALHTGKIALAARSYS